MAKEEHGRNEGKLVKIHTKITRANLALVKSFVFKRVDICSRNEEILVLH